MDWKEKIELPENYTLNTNMKTTKKLIDLDKETKISLSIKAAKKGTNLKNYIEILLKKHANK